MNLFDLVFLGRGGDMGSSCPLTPEEKINKSTVMKEIKNALNFNNA